MMTAYMLQCQLVNYVNIDGGRPGRSLFPILCLVLVLTLTGVSMSKFYHPNW